MTTTAKPRQGRRRAQPAPVPALFVHLAMWLGILSLFSPGWLAWTLRVLAVTIGVAYFVQHFRRAAWIVDQGIRAELDR